jgi:hypothetical protein
VAFKKELICNWRGGGTWSDDEDLWRHDGRRGVRAQEMRQTRQRDERVVLMH